VRPLAVVAAAFLLAGCSAGVPQPATQVRPRSTATIAIIAPVPGETITGRTLHVRLALNGGTLTPVTSSHLTPDLGHIHLSLDGRVVSMAFGLTQDLPVTPGDHLLQAEFVAQDHFPFNPRVVATATFTVK
jgi:hypothetical protein